MSDSTFAGRLWSRSLEFGDDLLHGEVAVAALNYFEAGAVETEARSGISRTC